VYRPAPNPTEVAFRPVPDEFAFTPIATLFTPPAAFDPITIAVVAIVFDVPILVRALVPYTITSPTNATLLVVVVFDTVIFVKFAFATVREGKDKLFVVIVDPNIV
jgi:hypothetical protein